RGHVGAPTGGVGAGGAGAVSVLESTILDHDVLARNVHPPTVGVGARLGRDAVVAGIKRAVLDDDVPARLRVTAVVVGPQAVDVDVANRHVGTQHGVQLPE